MKLGDYLEKYYNTPGHPIYMTNPKQLYTYLKTKGYAPTLSYIKQWVQDQRPYSLYKETRNKFPRVKTVLKGIHHLYDIDLADLSDLSKSNDNVKYLLVVVDGFSKYLSVRPLKTKGALEVKEAIADIFNQDKSPEILRSDAGKEFVNHILKQYLKTIDVRHIITHTTDKSYFAERVIKTLKRKIYQFITQTNSHRYIDALPKIVDSYNSAVHSSTHVAPKKMTAEMAKKLWWVIYKPKQPMKTKPFKFKINDVVRISYSKHTFTRAYDQTWSEEVFTIVGKYRKQGIPQYVLKDLKGEPIKGSFYEAELQKVSLPDYFPVEKVLRKRKVKGKVQYLVKYLGYSDPEWVTSTSISQV